MWGRIAHVKGNGEKKGKMGKSLRDQSKQPPDFGSSQCA